MGDRAAAAFGRTSEATNGSEASSAIANVLHRHWRQYLMEAAGLAAFISSACVVTTLVEFSGSPIRSAVGDPILRRVLIGIWMGLTIAAITYVPWGQKSGAHINPAVTWAFHRLGKIKTCDAVCYTIAQFLGALAGITLTAALLSRWIANPAIHFVVTEPGPMASAQKFSPWVAFAGEFVISFLLIYVLVRVIADKKREKLAGAIAGVLILIYIVVETPLSGMSLNPARSFASALRAQSWTAFWVYLFAPTVAMLIAAEILRRCSGPNGLENVPMYPKE